MFLHCVFTGLNMSSPIWTLGLAERHCEKKHDLHAICKCPVDKQDPTKFCNIKIGLNKGSTTSIRYHIRTKHALQWAQLCSAEKEREKKTSEDQSELQRIYREIESEAEVDDPNVPVVRMSQKRPLEEAFVSAPKRSFLSPLPAKGNPKTPAIFQKPVKFDVGDKRQLKFDLSFMKMMAMSDQSFEFANNKYVCEFFEDIIPQFHIKSSRTFSRNKLPQLFLNVKKAVDAKLIQDLLQCEGVGFTCDFWTSR